MTAAPIVLMTKADASTIVGGLSRPSKMPCKSWSIPVFACKRGAQLAAIPNSTCSICYADKGRYAARRDVIEPAQVARMLAIDDPLWVEAMVTLIATDRHFRWFDAGDLQDITMLVCIAEVVSRTPWTEHWLPTREYEIVAEYLAQYGPLPPNLTIRLSAFMIDAQAKIPAALRGVRGITTSEVHTGAPRPDVAPCPAYTQGGKCLDCRACWSRDVATVSYPAH